MLLHLSSGNHLVWCEYGTKGNDAHSILVQRGVSNLDQQLYNLRKSRFPLNATSRPNHLAHSSDRRHGFPMQDIIFSLSAHCKLQSYSTQTTVVLSPPNCCACIVRGTVSTLTSIFYLTGVTAHCTQLQGLVETLSILARHLKQLFSFLPTPNHHRITYRQIVAFLSIYTLQSTYPCSAFLLFFFCVTHWASEIRASSECVAYSLGN